MSDELSTLFDLCAADVERACCDLGHPYGWRFLTGPRSALNPATELAFITLNPGGDARDAHQSGPSFEAGSCYTTEQWREYPAGTAPLQRQVQALFSELMRHREEERPVEEFLATRVLSAHFIPFRSPSFAELHEPAQSLTFARGLWSRILHAWQPRLILTIDQKATEAIASILSGQLGAVPHDSQRFPTGWGQYQASVVRYRLPGNGRTVTLGRLPHLSRFTLFTEPGYGTSRKAALEPFFRYITT